MIPRTFTYRRQVFVLSYILLLHHQIAATTAAAGVLSSTTQNVKSSSASSSRFLVESSNGNLTTTINDSVSDPGLPSSNYSFVTSGTENSNNDTINSMDEMTNNNNNNDSPIESNNEPTETNNHIHVFLLALVSALAFLTVGDGMYRLGKACFYPPADEEKEEDEKFSPEERKEQWIDFFIRHKVQTQVTKEYLIEDEAKIVPSAINNVATTQTIKAWSHDNNNNNKSKSQKKKKKKTNADDEEKYQKPIFDKIEVTLGTDDKNNMNNNNPKHQNPSSVLDATNIVLSRTRTDASATDSSSQSSSSNNSSSSSTTGDEEEKPSQSYDDIEVTLGMLQLPGRSPVSNGCAICLELYHEGDSVIWSTNHSCSHVFHQECIVFYCLSHEQQKAARLRGGGGGSYSIGGYRHQQQVQQPSLEQQQQQQQQQSNNRPHHHHPKREPTPCPICRQPFDDFPDISNSDQIDTTKDENTHDGSNNNNNNNQGSDNNV